MTSDRQRPRRTFLIPSIPDLVFIGLACLQVAAASMILLNRDGDLARHIAVGKVMLANRALVQEDFFSHTAYGQPFLAYEWLSQLIFAAVHELAGLDGVAVLTAVVSAFASALVAGVGGMLLLQAATVVVPPLRTLLRTTPLGVGDLVLIGAGAATPLLVREALKVGSQQGPNRGR